MTRLSLRGPVFRASTLLLAVLLVLLVAACDTPEEKEARHLARGIEFAEAGDDAKAMIELRNVLRLNAKNAEALYEVGLIHERAERWAQAYNAFEAAVAERPGYVDANLKIGTLALMSNEVEIAEKAAADILTVHPGNPDGEVLEAAVMLRRGDIERALALAEAVLAADPRHENAVGVVAGVLQARGRADEALDRIDKALTMLTDNIGLRALKVMIAEQIGDVGSARAVYEELVALEPDNATHRLALSSFLLRNGDTVGAEIVLRDAIDLDVGTEEIGQALVQLIHQERGSAAAEAEIQRLIAQLPDSSRLRFLLAELLTDEERFADAEMALRGIVDGSDKDASQDAKAAIARLRLDAGDLEAARATADEVLSVNKDHRGANLVLGLAHLLENSPDEAIRSARTALRQDAAWTPGLKLIAEAHLSKGETDLAISALGAAVAVDPSDTAAAAVYAALLTQRGDFDAALKVWDRLVDTAPDPSMALQNRASIHLQQQSWSAAQADIAQLLETPGQEHAGAILAGTLDLGRNRYDASREWFRRGLELQPELSGPLVGIIRAFVTEGDAEGALAFLDQRINSRPEDALAFAMKGELLADRNDVEEAAVALEAAIRLQPEWPYPYHLLAMLEKDRAGDLDAPVAVYERALMALPDSTEILGGLAGALVTRGRNVEAMVILERLMAVDPVNIVAANNYAALVADYAYEDAAKLERAFEIAERFITSTDASLLDTLGWLYFRKGDYASALTYIERAVTLASNDPQLRFHLGMALKASGQTERARVELTRAVVEGADYHGLDEAKSTLAGLEAESASETGG